jgi:hypothetical protein
MPIEHLTNVESINLTIITISFMVFIYKMFNSNKKK